MPDQPTDAAGTVDLAAALGADEGTSVDCFTIYVPDKNRDGVGIGNQRKRVLEAIQVLSEINGGATALPPAEGVWRSPDGRLVREQPVVVYSFVMLADFVRELPRIREFLHRLGRETNQGEIAFEFGDKF